MSEETEVKKPKTVKPTTRKKAKPKMKRAGVVVEHRSRGRTRVRVRKDLRTPEHMANIKAQLEQHPDVESVKVSHQTGSVVIKHKHERDGRELIKESFEGVEIVAGMFLDVPLGEDEEGGGRDQKLADLIARLDEWQYQRTHVHGQGVVVSGAIAGLGILQIAIYGISLEMLPGPVLIYIGYDIHRRVRLEEKAHREAREAAEQTDDTSPAPAAEAPLPGAA